MTARMLEDSKLKLVSLSCVFLYVVNLMDWMSGEVGKCKRLCDIEDLTSKAVSPCAVLSG